MCVPGQIYSTDPIINRYVRVSTPFAADLYHRGYLVGQTLGSHYSALSLFN